MKEKISKLPIIVKILIITLIALIIGVSVHYYQAMNSPQKHIENLKESLDKDAERMHPNGYESLEEYFTYHQIDLAAIKSDYEEDGFTVEITGNDLIASLEMNELENFTEEYCRSDRFDNNMDKQFEEEKDIYEEQTKDLCEETGIKEARYIYRYTYNGDIVYEKIVGNPDLERE